MVEQELLTARSLLGPFHVHRGHDFEGFQIEERPSDFATDCCKVAVSALLVARCSCGEVLDLAEAAFSPCPECDGQRPCVRCGGTGLVVDHAALEWRLPEEGEDLDADAA